MNILFITPHTLRYWGGNEKWVAQVGNLLIQRGHKVKLLTLNIAPNNIYRVTDDYVKTKIKFEHSELNTRGGRFYPLNAADFPEIDADVIYTTVPYYGFLKQILKNDCPKVWGFHDPSLLQPSNLLQKRIISNLVPRFDFIHLLSEIQMYQFTKINYIKVLETTWLHDIKPLDGKFDEFTVIFFGRHENSKGIDTLLNVRSKLDENIKFLVAGKGSRSDNLRRALKEEEFLGFLEDEELEYYVGKSHATIFPSYSESTTSMVAMESLANSTPLIYRDLPFNRSLSKFEMNIGCRTDDDFLNATMLLYKRFISAKNAYIDSCRMIPSKILPVKDYIDSFLNDILVPALERYNSGTK